MSTSIDVGDLCDGTITVLEPRGKRGERVAVSIEDLYTFELSAELVRHHALAEGDTLSADMQRRLLVENELDEAKDVALNYLSYKPRTKTEVERRLRRDDYREVVIDEVVTYLEEREYIDDKTYARLFAEERFTSKGYGPYRVEQDLRKRGVAAEAIEDALAEVYDSESMREEALRQAEKRWPRLSGESDTRKRKKKLYDFLARRGFPFEIVRAVVDRVSG